MRSLAGALALCLFAVPLAAQTAPTTNTGFTIDSAEAAVQRQQPHARRAPTAVPAGVQVLQDLVYARPDGQPLALDLYKPTAVGPRPAVLIVHGGGWDSGSRQMEHPLAAQLAARGWVAVPVSYRLGAAGRFPAALHDLQAALRWLREHASAYGIDASRPVVLGASSGGQLAALLGALGQVQAAVDIDGLVDFADPGFVAEQAAQPSAPTRFLGGPFASRADTWRAASALSHVGAHSAPTLFINSTAASPPLPGRPQMLQALRAAGVTAELLVMPDTPHPFWLFQPWFEQVVDETDAFLRRTLGRP